MPKEDATTEVEMIVRQISWLHVYCLELNCLEQPGMPKDKHQEVMTLRGEAPQFFQLVSSLLKDALILGLDNLLDTPQKKEKLQLTIEHIVNGLTNQIVQKKCQTKLKQIKSSKSYREVKIARNHLIAHPNHKTLLQYDHMSAKKNFPNLTISDLEKLLRQTTDLAALALGKLPSEFWFPDWNGVCQLFNVLRAAPTK